VYLHSLHTGKRLKRLAEDHVGSISVSGKRTDQPQLFLSLNGYTTPGTIMKYDLSLPLEKAVLETYRKTELKGLDPDEFHAEQVISAFFYTAVIRANYSYRFGTTARMARRFRCLSCAM
jgi:prolyl oligopeptidase